MGVAAKSYATDERDCRIDSLVSSQNHSSLPPNLATDMLEDDASLSESWILKSTLKLAPILAFLR